MNKIQSHSNAEAKKNAIRLNYWTIAWVISVGLLGLGPQLIWSFNTLSTIFAGLINVTVGIGMIMANIRFIKGQDEMQEKIFLEAAALTLGVTVVCGGSYQLWEDIKLISFEPQVWHLMCVIGLTFIIGITAVSRKYQ